MRSLATGMEAYRVDNNQYPPMSDKHGNSTWSLFQDIGAGGDDHARTPSYLTTPIAYLSALPNDPFIPSSTLTGSQHVVEIGKRFAYFNYPQFIDSATGAAADAHRNRMAKNGPWLMYGYGPDQDTLNGPANSVYVNYDATNGTVSHGNIFRTQ